MRDTSPIPGGRLVGLGPLLAALVVLVNDFWLKPHAPGLVSGKLSDVGLCFLLPVVLASLVEWTHWGLAMLRSRAWPSRPRWIDALSCVVAAVWFSALKLSPQAASLHAASLNAVLPFWHFSAIADPTDLVALPLVLLALSYLRARAEGAACSKPCRVPPSARAA